MDGETAFERGAQRAWRLWLWVTGGFLALAAAALALGGAPLLQRCVQADALSISAQTLACAALVWAAWGGGVGLLRRRALRDRYGWHIALCGVLLILYVNVLRERAQYADVQDYVRAAFELQAGKPFHIRYLYPPFLATLCQPFLFLGEDGLAALFWAANWAGFALFFLLLAKVLERYGVAPRAACFGVFAFMLVNVPVLRTLSFIQVNFHMMNLILLAVLLYPRHRLLSALMLALAVHLKASPLVLALPFVCARDKRWLAGFVFCGSALFAATALLYGWAPYEAFLANVRTLYAANGICFRENSIDALVRATAAALQADGTALVPFVKVPSVLALAGCAAYAVRARMWSDEAGAAGCVWNGLPLLLVLMVFVSPLVWEHHFVFLAVPFLLLLRKLESPGEWAWFGTAYVAVFWMPTFDFYPWSFCRLAGACVLTALSLRLARRGVAPAFEALERGLEEGLGALGRRWAAKGRGAG
jgi:hypothetical protein